jgi:hypothetical protein
MRGNLVSMFIGLAVSKCVAASKAEETLSILKNL